MSFATGTELAREYRYFDWLRRPVLARFSDGLSSVEGSVSIPDGLCLERLRSYWLSALSQSSLWASRMALHAAEDGLTAGHFGSAGSWASSPCTPSRSMLGANGANWTPCPQPYYHSERRHWVAMVLWREAVTGGEVSVESSLGFSSYVQALGESERMARDKVVPVLFAENAEPLDSRADHPAPLPPPSDQAQDA